MLKRILLLAVVCVVLAGAAIGAYWALTSRSAVPPARDHTVDRSPTAQGRGTYLATQATGCLSCHSKREWTRFSGPIVVGTEGQGGQLVSREHGFPGAYFAKNITPTGIGSWSDGELERFLLTGATQTGEVSPHPDYRALCQADLDAIIAFVRALPPLPGTHAPPDVSFMTRVEPRSVDGKRPPCPSVAEPLVFGAYLAALGQCASCHTDAVSNGARYAGGSAFTTPTGVVRASNITPDAETGIGSWTKEMFVKRFRGHAVGEEPVVSASDMQSVMPWQASGGMSEEDLGALYDFLRSVPAVKNVVSPAWQPSSR